MADLAELAGINHLFGKGNRGDPAVIENDEISDLGFAHGGEHFFGISHIQSQRFLAHDVFAGAGGGRGDFGMGNIRGAESTISIRGDSTTSRQSVAAIASRAGRGRIRRGRGRVRKWCASRFWL